MSSRPARTSSQSRSRDSRFLPFASTQVDAGSALATTSRTTRTTPLIVAELGASLGVSATHRTDRRLLGIPSRREISEKFVRVRDSERCPPDVFVEHGSLILIVRAEELQISYLAREKSPPHHSPLPQGVGSHRPLTISGSTNLRASSSSKRSRIGSAKIRRNLSSRLAALDDLSTRSRCQRGGRRRFSRVG
jgi:hypothetical protein